MADALIDKHMEVAESLVQEGNKLGALVAYRQAAETAPQDSSLAAEIGRRIRALEADLGLDGGGTGAVEPGAFESRVDDDQGARGMPALKGVSRASLLGPILLTFLVVGVLLFALSLAAGEWVTSTGQSINSRLGFGAGQALGAGGLAVLAGLLQVWIFRHRIRGSRRLAFILTTTLGGVLGGLAGGALITGGERNSFLIGAVIGLVAGAVSSLAQNRLMKSHGTAGVWFVWSALSWLLIWGAGWYASWTLNGTLGFAAGGALILVLLGASLALFLLVKPEIEF